MRLFNETKTWAWDIDRFHFFTESEKSGIWESLKRSKEIWERIDNSEGGITDMLKDLIKEIEISMEK